MVKEDPREIPIKLLTCDEESLWVKKFHKYI